MTYYGIEATHSQMCKFASSSAPGYRAVSTDIYQWAVQSPGVIARRWQIEEEERTAHMRQEICERISPLVSRRCEPDETLYSGLIPQMVEQQGGVVMERWRWAADGSSVAHPWVSNSSRRSSPVPVYQDDNYCADEAQSMKLGGL